MSTGLASARSATSRGGETVLFIEPLSFVLMFRLRRMSPDGSATAHQEPAGTGVLGNEYEKYSDQMRTDGIAPSKTRSAPSLPTQCSTEARTRNGQFTSPGSCMGAKSSWTLRKFRSARTPCRSVAAFSLRASGSPPSASKTLSCRTPSRLLLPRRIPRISDALGGQYALRAPEVRRRHDRSAPVRRVARSRGPPRGLLLAVQHSQLGSINKPRSSSVIKPSAFTDGRAQHVAQEE